MGICPVSIVNGIGIGDGCTTSYGGYNLANIPQVGLFKGTFTPACKNHDKCVTTLGKTVGECNSQFLSEMRSACDSEFISWLQPAEYTACRASAQSYKSAVDLYFQQVPDAFVTLQRAALGVSRQLQPTVYAETCATSPEITTLYTPSLIAKINSIFSSYVGRNPNIYEFLQMVNSNDVVADPVGWENALRSYAVTRMYSPYSPVDFYWTTSGSAFALKFNLFAASNTVSNLTWSISNYPITYGSTIQIPTPAGAYDRKYVISGYLKSTPIGGNIIDSSIALIGPLTVRVPGSCGPAGCR